MTSHCCVFKFLRLSVDGKHLMRFQGETSVFKFLRRSVDGALIPFCFITTSLVFFSLSKVLF